MSSRPSLAALGALAALSAAGCFPLEDPNDPLVRAKRDAAAAERGIIRRRRDRTWFLVKTWVQSVPGDAAPLEGAVPIGDCRAVGSAPASADRAPEGPSIGRFGPNGEPDVPAASPSRPPRGVLLALVSPPKAPGALAPDGSPAVTAAGRHSSMLLREGEAGFVATARSEPLGKITLSGKTYGGEGERVDRGFDAVPRLLGGGRVELLLKPVFRRLAEGGADLALPELSFGVALGPDETLALDAAGEPMDPVVRALFFEVAEEGERPTRRRLYVQVEAFR